MIGEPIAEAVEMDMNVEVPHISEAAPAHAVLQSVGACLIAVLSIELPQTQVLPFFVPDSL